MQWISKQSCIILLQNSSVFLGLNNWTDLNTLSDDWIYMNCRLDILAQSEWNTSSVSVWLHKLTPFISGMALYLPDSVAKECE